jgi:hypothetical protein
MARNTVPTNLARKPVWLVLGLGALTVLSRFNMLPNPLPAGRGLSRDLASLGRVLN